MNAISPPPLPSNASGGIRASALLAVGGSVLAGLIHASVVVGRAGDPGLVVLLAAAAVAQLGWAVAALENPSSRVWMTGLCLNGIAVVVWGFSWAAGLPVVGSSGSGANAGLPGLTAAIFAATSALAALCTIRRPEPRRMVTSGWARALAVVALVAAVPAINEAQRNADSVVELTAGQDSAGQGTAGQDTAGRGTAGHDAVGHDAVGDGTAAHGAAGHDAVGDGTAGHGTVGDGTAGHGTVGDGTAGHGTVGDGTAGHDADGHDTDSGTVSPTGPIISLDDPRVTAAERAIAVSLIEDVTAAMVAFPTVEAVQSAGYQSIGDGGAFGFEHFVNWSYLYDGIELDPSRIESIVVKKNGAEPKQVVSAMYILNPGQTMADIPMLAGELTSWHLHDNLCFEGYVVVAIAVGGVCSSGTLTVTPPMLHVWLIPRPCGPFAGLEADGEACTTHLHS